MLSPPLAVARRGRGQSEERAERREGAAEERLPERVGSGGVEERAAGLRSVCEIAGAEVEEDVVEGVRWQINEAASRIGVIRQPDACAAR